MQAVAREVGWRNDELSKRGTRSVALSLRIPDRDWTRRAARSGAPSVTPDKPVLGIGIPDGWSRGTEGHRAYQRAPWRQVIVAWLLAVVVFLTVIPLLQNLGFQGRDTALTRLAQAAHAIAHPRTPQSNDADEDDICSERDFANELC